MAGDPGDDAEPYRLAQHNRQFHGALYRAAHNRYLLKTLNVLRDAMALLGSTTLSLTGRSDTARDEHAAIVHAVEARDVDADEAEARARLRAAQRDRIRILFGDDTAAGHGQECRR